LGEDSTLHLPTPNTPGPRSFLRCSCDDPNSNPHYRSMFEICWTTNAKLTSILIS
jgi:hypothetical protein